MADRTVRPTDRTLRAAGLVSKELPRHHIARGENVPGQFGPVSQVFGPVEVYGDTTSVRVASVRYVSGPGTDKQPGHSGALVTVRGTLERPIRHQVGVIEVNAKGVHIRASDGKVPLLIAGILLAAWNIYWIVRALREGRTRTG